MKMEVNFPTPHGKVVETWGKEFEVADGSKINYVEHYLDNGKIYVKAVLLEKDKGVMNSDKLTKFLDKHINNVDDNDKEYLVELENGILLVGKGYANPRYEALNRSVCVANAGIKFKAMHNLV